MKRLFFILLLAAIVSAPCTIEAKSKKKVKHKSVQAEKYAFLNDIERKIVGKHMLSLQWLSTEYYGYATITKEADGSFSCKGEQLARNCKDADPECIANDDYIKLDGVIDIVDANRFLFVGEIREKIHYINNGEEVLRQGTFNFVAKGNRKYWRMQETLNPTGECADYIDIYFKKYSK